MIRIFITFAILFVLAREAISEPVLPGAQLKELVTVTGELVRIGDLVDGAGAAADIAVFRAPDLGQTGTVPVARVTAALRPHGITGLGGAGFTELVVTRLSHAITPKDIEDRIARAVAGQHGFGDAKNLTVIMDREPRPLHIEASANAELAIVRMNVDPRSGRFDVSFDVPGSGAARRLSLRFTGSVAETVEAATLTRALARGDVVRQADIVIERKPKAEVGGEALAPEQAVGLATKRSLRPGQVLRANDLMKHEVVQRNETVTIFYEMPGIQLTMRGKALEAGSAGDPINVLNTQSNRTVQAVVAGPGRVIIAAIQPRVAAAVAPDHTVRPSAE